MKLDKMSREIGHIPKGMRVGRRELNTASLKIAEPQSMGALTAEQLAQMREVLEVFVPLVDRNKRLATALLNFVCQEADVNGITLILTARQFGDSLGPDEARLVSWYEKFGFTVLQQVPTGTIMARQVRARPKVPALSRVATAVKRLLH